MVVVGIFTVYGLLLIIEAFLSYRGSGGKAVLLAGVCSGLIAIASGVLLKMEIPIGASIGIGLILAMMAVFGTRYMRTRAFFPAGVMMIVSLIAIGALARSMK